MILCGILPSINDDNGTINGKIHFSLKGFSKCLKQIPKLSRYEKHAVFVYNIRYGKVQIC